jgi:hypothetical protein
MLEEIQSVEEANLDAFSIEDEFRDRKPQNNILLDYLKKVQMHGSEAALTGFASVLTDALAFPGTCASLYRDMAQEA